MKLTVVGVCTCLLLGASSSFAQTPKAPPSPPANGTSNGATPDNGTQGAGMGPGGNAAPSPDAQQSGDQGGEGSKPTAKECQDLKARETQRLGGDPVQDKACAKILKSNGGDSSQ